jgi:hypothetical protein
LYLLQSAKHFVCHFVFLSNFLINECCQRIRHLAINTDAILVVQLTLITPPSLSSGIFSNVFRRCGAELSRRLPDEAQLSLGQFNQHDGFSLNF